MFRRNLPERDEYGRIDGVDLRLQMTAAVRQFLPRRIAVLRRPTPDAVGDPDVAPGQLVVAKRPVQDVPRAADERLARRIDAARRDGTIAPE